MEDTPGPPKVYASPLDSTIHGHVNLDEKVEGEEPLYHSPSLSLQSIALQGGPESSGLIEVYALGAMLTNAFSKNMKQIIFPGIIPLIKFMIDEAVSLHCWRGGNLPQLVFKTADYYSYNTISIYCNYLTKSEQTTLHCIIS